MSGLVRPVVEPTGAREVIDWSKPKRIHLIGVAGTGMGSFAGMLKAAGHAVTGSDENVYPPMSTQLERWGIEV
ncbi:MAG TPA: Mur ligase domain-containing protein, partial [Anaeromyxobacter sp.]|nr:Mur ligase domain-containing protein [Anaeromyxobacter sp.]